MGMDEVDLAPIFSPRSRSLLLLLLLESGQPH